MNLNINTGSFLKYTCVFPPLRSCVKLRDIEAELTGAARNDETILQNPNAINS